MNSRPDFIPIQVSKAMKTRWKRHFLAKRKTKLMRKNENVTG